jgi:hypothetical protein
MDFLATLLGSNLGYLLLLPLGRLMWQIGNTIFIVLFGVHLTCFFLQLVEGAGRTAPVGVLSARSV